MRGLREYIPNRLAHKERIVVTTGRGKSTVRTYREEREESRRRRERLEGLRVPGDRLGST